jgi:hypothetical protein
LFSVWKNTRSWKAYFLIRIAREQRSTNREKKENLVDFFEEILGRFAVKKSRDILCILPRALSFRMLFNRSTRWRFTYFKRYILSVLCILLKKGRNAKGKRSNDEK